MKELSGAQSAAITWKGLTTAAWRDSSTTLEAESVAWTLQARWPDTALLF